MKWKYIRDGWMDIWTIGGVSGDCEDYALTLLRVEAGSVWKPLLRGEYALVRCWVNGNPHVVLQRGESFNDVRYRRWQTWDKFVGYERAYKLPMWFIAVKLIHGRIFSG